MKLPDHCPICETSWTKMQSPWFRHLEYVHCEKCRLNASSIIKLVEKNPSLKKSKKDSTYSYGNMSFWGRD